jgi:hypothetical protein
MAKMWNDIKLDPVTNRFMFVGWIYMIQGVELLITETNFLRWKELEILWSNK